MKNELNEKLNKNENFLDSKKINDIETEKDNSKSFVNGIVTDCTMLNVRKKPSIVSNVIVVLFNGSPVSVDKTYNNSEWYKILTATKDSGFVMKDYIAIKE